MRLLILTLSVFSLLAFATACGKKDDGPKTHTGAYGHFDRNQLPVAGLHPMNWNALTGAQIDLVDQFYHDLSSKLGQVAPHQLEVMVGIPRQQQMNSGNLSALQGRSYVFATSQDIGLGGLTQFQTQEVTPLIIAISTAPGARDQLLLDLQGVFDINQQPMFFLAFGAANTEILYRSYDSASQVYNQQQQYQQTNLSQIIPIAQRHGVSILSDYSDIFKAIGPRARLDAFHAEAQAVFPLQVLGENAY